MNNSNTPERVLVVARVPQWDADRQESLRELHRLVETAGGQIVGESIQVREGFDPASYLGKGKVEEVAAQVTDLKADLVVLNGELSPSQQRNLEQAFKVKVIDRTGLILDIFARHATTREGKLQVELAQLNYMMPRLVGQVSHWSRLGGGIGTLGPGETLLEMERRRLRRRVTHLKQQLNRVAEQRQLQRQRRQQVPLPLVSLVGYTNAGKSSLMKRITEAEVLIQDALFATLDPRVRRVKLPSGRECLLADTVGFISDLPHQLIEAFKATLQEIGGASLLLHVIDGSHPAVLRQVATVERVLKELGLGQHPCLKVINKQDRILHDQIELPYELAHDPENILVSAHTGAGIDLLLAEIDRRLAGTEQRLTLDLPYDAGPVLAELYRSCRVLTAEHGDHGIRVVVDVGPQWVGKLAAYLAA